MKDRVTVRKQMRLGWRVNGEVTGEVEDDSGQYSLGLNSVLKNLGFLFTSREGF